MSQGNPARDLFGALLDIGINPKTVKLSGDSATNPAIAQLTQHNLRKHNALITEHAQHLADRGVQVQTAEYGCGHKITVGLIQNAYGNKGGQLTNFKYDNINCSTCRGY